MDNAVGWDTARMGRYFILSEVVYDKGLQAAYAAIETRSLHKADSQAGRMQMGDSKRCAGTHERGIWLS